MRSQPATTALTAAAAALLPGLPDEIVVLEILVRLPPKPLLRCRSVSRGWHRATSTHDFLLAHHGRQPSLPIVCGFENVHGYDGSITVFDRRAAADAQLQHVARLDPQRFTSLEASCDGLLVIATPNRRFSICNPATRQRGFLRQPREASGYIVLGLYPHLPSGEYRLLLYRTSNNLEPPKHIVGCYVSALGSDQPPRYIGGPEAVTEWLFDPCVLLQDCLHWSPRQQLEIVAFDTTAESFRQMSVPILPTESYIDVFEMDGKLGIHRHDGSMKSVDIWVLSNYEDEVWEYMYRVELPATEIRRHLGRRLRGRWCVNVAWTYGAVLLQLTKGHWLFYIDVDGELVGSFRREGELISSASLLQLKQTLVHHTFFEALEDYAVNASPFI
ncbi:unnamed protein product [Alopecurus aequalis]